MILSFWFDFVNHNFTFFSNIFNNFLQNLETALFSGGFTAIYIISTRFNLPLLVPFQTRIPLHSHNSQPRISDSWTP